MWSELSLPWQAALEEAWSASCAGCAPIGAVVVNAAGEIIARGRNHNNDQTALPGQICLTQLAHAELNALLAVKCNHGDLHQCAIYSTMEPCPLCMGAIYMSGVRRIYYACRDTYAGSVDMLGSTAYLSSKPVKAVGPERSDLENILAAIQAEDILVKFPGQRSVVLEEWRQVYPTGVALGERLASSQKLYALRVHCLPVSEVLDWLESQLINLAT
jgi:tRNA(Arg) A34 adenosine deaminase TadA